MMKLTLNKFQLLLPLVNYFFVRYNKEKKSSKLSSLNKLIVLDNIVILSIIITIIISHNYVIVGIILYFYNLFLYFILNNKRFKGISHIVEFIIVAIASLIGIIAFLIFAVVIIQQILYCVNWIYPFLMNVYEDPFICLPFIELLLFLLIKSFLLVRIVATYQLVEFKQKNKRLRRLSLTSLFIIAIISFGYNYYNTNNIFKHVILTHKFPQNQVVYYLNNQRVNDYTNNQATAITVNREFGEKVNTTFNSYVLKIAQKIVHNDQIYELRISYTYFYVDRNSSRPDENTSTYNELYIRLEGVENEININDQDAKLLINQGIEAINNNVLNQMFASKTRFNQEYWGNFNDTRVIVNGKDSGVKIDVGD